MDADNDLLEKTLERIVESQAGPEISLEYTLRDQEDAREELIFRAVEDAINKAYIISQASGVGMGDILTIQYSMEEPDFISPTRNHIPEAAVMMAARTGGQKLAGDVRPMNIELEDTVTIILGIS